MGAAYANVHNDTDEKQKIYVFSYGDGLRVVPKSEHYIKPHSTIKVTAAACFWGLIVSTKKFKNGHHAIVPNGETLKFSELLEKPGNPWAIPVVITSSVGVGAVVLAGTILSCGALGVVGAGVGAGAAGTAVAAEGAAVVGGVGAVAATEAAAAAGGLGALAATEGAVAFGISGGAVVAAEAAAVGAAGAAVVAETAAVGAGCAAAVAPALAIVSEATVAVPLAIATGGGAAGMTWHGMTEMGKEDE